MNRYNIPIKDKAIALRKRGLGIRSVEKQLDIPRSTLNGWFKNIHLTERQKAKLHENWLQGLVKAREIAAEVHREGRRKRIETAEKSARDSFENINLKDKNLLKLVLSVFFFAEGFKVAEDTTLGNSDPLCVKAFIKLLMTLYDFDMAKLRIYLHLRADQNPQKEITFWSKELNVKSSQFKIGPVDKRTIGKPTYPNYHGVCVVRYYDVSIKRELLALANIFFNKITKMDA